ncbi:hypothetical protein CFOLD11_11710 [Clostridium folliculivorans]|uniref:Tetratricopeptide repeat protein n=1 Tax=Clostridium folliculivorans TaxID=2886038 RepID=A0A9W6D9I1_9CLOT|nr:tetratricopeptide repeat protein [Clostridium folliculivorans]GKU24345.1 hypothetical protein CFOLD11_11710 [Clostridium folliculivorans]
MKCPKCSTEMIKGKKYWICEECEERVPIIEDLGSGEFNINAMNEFPTIIAHEYHRLKELSTAGEAYGTFMQIKDMYEVILKFPVLIMMEGLIYSLKNEGENECRNSILRAFIEKPLSLGDWEVTASRISRLTDEELPQRNLMIYGETRTYLKNIIKLFKVKINGTEKYISSWRNDEIAHGALAFDDVDFRNEIGYMLSNIHEIMRKSEKYYSQIEIINDKGIVLKGHNIESMDEQNEIYISFSMDSKEDNITLMPLVYSSEIYIYLFDSFSHYSNIAYRLNYSHGKKDKCYKSVDTFLEIKKILNVEELTSETIKRENHLVTQLKKIDEILKTKKIIKPTYLNDYLMKILGFEKDTKQYTSGVFMIRTERGMGKTVFTKVLDDLDNISSQEEKPSFYNKVIKRVYHINSTYGSELSTFKHMLQNDLCSTLQKANVYVGEIRDEFTRLDMCQSTDSIKKQFAVILNKAFYELNRAYVNETGVKREKFLMVIDGLDEFNYKYKDNIRTIFDYIPTPDMLAEGIYILLTCRTDGELINSERIRKEINNIKLTLPEISIIRTSGEYVSLLKKHLIKNLSISEAKEQDELLKLLDYRFSYLGAYEKLYSSNLYNKNELNPKNIIKTYMNYLQSANKRHYESIKKLLLILAIAPSGIRVDELCYLMNEQEITYRLLGSIADISNFVETKRENGATVMSITHVDWKENLLQNYKEEIGELLEELKESVYSLFRELWSDPIAQGYKKYQKDFAKYRGMFYLFSNYLDMSQYFREINNITISDDELRENSEAFYSIEPLMKVPSNEYERMQIRINYLSGIIIESLNINEKTLGDYLILSDVFIKRCATFEDLNLLQEAKRDCECAIQIREDLYKNGFLEESDLLAEAYTKRGNLNLKFNLYNEGLEDLQSAIEIRESLDKEGTLPDRYDLAMAYMDKGVGLNRLYHLEEGLEEFERAIEIIESLDREGKLFDKSVLASLHINKGASFVELNSLEQALKEYESAIKILGGLTNEEEVYNVINLAKAHMNRGQLFRVMNRLEEALEDNKIAVEIMESLHKSERLPNVGDLAEVYDNRGNVLLDLNKSEEALCDYEIEVEIYKALESVGRLTDENKLAHALNSRGVALKNLGNFEEALSDFNSVIQIREELAGKGKLDDRNTLITAYNNRIDVFKRLNRIDELVSDYEKIITNIKELEKNEQLTNKDHLAKVYADRGMTLCNFNMFKEALADLERAKDLWESLSEEGGQDYKNQLAKLYVNTGGIFYNLNLVGDGLVNFKRAIEIMEELYEGGMLKDIDNLAIVCMNSGLALNSLNQLEEALKYYNKAYNVMGGMDKHIKITNKDLLAAICMNRGATLCKLNLLTEALNDFNKVIEITGHWEKQITIEEIGQLQDVYSNRALVLTELKLFSEAYKDFSKVLEYNKILVNENYETVEEYLQLILYIAEMLKNNVDDLELQKLFKLYYEPICKLSSSKEAKQYIRKIEKIVDSIL